MYNWRFPYLFYKFPRWICRSAARRDRLDGTTFKFLNLGAFLSFVYLTMLQFADRSCITTINFVRASATIFGSLATGKALLQYGFPVIKLKGSNILSVFYLACSVLTLISQLKLNSLFFKANGKIVLNCFVNPFEMLLEPAIYLALAGAAIAGPKRLSSDTYKKLNLTLMLSLIVRIFFSRAIFCDGLTRTVTDVGRDVVGLLSTLIGYLRGEMFGKDEPKLLKAFTSHSFIS